MKKDWMALLWQGGLEPVLETNQVSGRFGLALTKTDAELILKERTQVLKDQKRVEFGEGIVPKLIYEFCDSDYIDQDCYVDTILRLQDIFYRYKNEMQDEVTDDELLNFMREQFEEVCFGDLDYLEETCLSVFAREVRAGYRGYQVSQGRGEYGEFDEVTRWDPEVYLEALNNQEAWTDEL